MISSHFVYNKSNDVCPSFHIDAFNVLIFNYENGVGGVDNFKSVFRPIQNQLPDPLHKVPPHSIVCIPYAIWQAVPGKTKVHEE